MKIVEIVDVLNVGNVMTTADWGTAWQDIEDAIAATDWPHGSGNFSINPVRKGNGVVPIKLPCLRYLKDHGWQVECLPKELAGVQMGNLDAMRGAIGFEWETGNISSSHRAINRFFWPFAKVGSSPAFWSCRVCRCMPT